MLKAEFGNVSVIRKEEGRVEIGLRDYGWTFQTVGLAEAKLIGMTLIAAAEEEQCE